MPYRTVDFVPSRYPNGRDLRIAATFPCGGVLGVATITPEMTVGEALERLYALEQLVAAHDIEAA